MSGRIGIITGSGPEAGIDLWSKLLEENRASLGTSFRGDIDAPDVTILSVPELGHSMNLPATTDLVWSHLRSAVERLDSQVDVFAIACNTLYAFEEAIEDLGLRARLVSPVDCVGAEAARRSTGSIALLGAGPVTDFGGGSSPYARLAGPIDIELPPDPGRLHRLIEQIKVEGGPTPDLETEFELLTAPLRSEVAMLACTELPLLTADGVEVELVDVTLLLARELLRAAKGAS